MSRPPIIIGSGNSLDALETPTTHLELVLTQSSPHETQVSFALKSSLSIDQTQHHRISTDVFELVTPFSQHLAWSVGEPSRWFWMQSVTQCISLPLINRRQNLLGRMRMGDFLFGFHSYRDSWPPLPWSQLGAHFEGMAGFRVLPGFV